MAVASSWCVAVEWTEGFGGGENFIAKWPGGRGSRLTLYAKSRGLELELVVLTRVR